MLAVLLCMSVLPMLAENAPAEQAKKILNGIVIGSDGDTPLTGVVIYSKENPLQIHVLAGKKLKNSFMIWPMFFNI